MKARSRFLSILPLLTLAALPALAQSKGKTPPPPPKKTDTKPPEKKPEAKKSGVGSELDGAISLTDATGKAHTFKDYRGKVLVIDFWSMEPSDEAYSKRLTEMADELGKKGVQFVGIDPSGTDTGDADAGKKINDYAQKNGISFPILLDKGGAVAKKLGARMTPEVLVVDAKGIVRYTGAIDDDPKGEKADKATHYLRSAVEAVMSGKDPTTATTPPNGSPIKSEKPPEPAAKGKSEGTPPKK